LHIIVIIIIISFGYAGTLNQMLKAPAHNNDHLAAVLRDELMPVRSAWLKSVPWAPMQLKVRNLYSCEDDIDPLGWSFGNLLDK